MGLKIYFDGVDIASLYPEITGMYTSGGGVFGEDYRLMSCGVFWLDIPLDTMPQTARIVFDEWIEVKDLGDATLLTQVIPSQLLAYYLALELGYDPDKPRNLAKSVTVE